MDIVLLVGVVPYDYPEKLEIKYPNTLFIYEGQSNAMGAPKRIVELVRIANRVVMMDVAANESAYATAALVLGKQICKFDDVYYVDQESKRKEGEVTF